MAAQNQGGPLFAAVRRGKLKPGMAGEFAKRVKAGAVPVMTGMPGFKSYYLVFGADDAVIAMILFATREQAEACNRQLMPWIKENVAPMLAGPPEAIEGEVVVSA